MHIIGGPPPRKEDPMPKAKTMSLPCRLTDEEMLLKAAELATLVVEVEHTEGRLKVRRTELRAELKKGRQRAAELAKVVANRTEDREVEVYEEPDPGTGLVWTVRRDTGARVDSRPMTAEDRQLELVPGKVLSMTGGGEEAAAREPDARSGERASERTHERAHERALALSAGPPTCACDHAPVDHDAYAEELGGAIAWGACQLCDCPGSGAARPADGEELAF